ncbi:MAG: lactate racemase domain-containing protein [Dehalococcoidales bacterium]|nr:lactate racemase domain-containing protein [Dehalococcoidales bacterium]
MDPVVTLDYPRSPITPEIAAIELPRVMKVRQRIETPEIKDVPEAVKRELERVNLAERIKPGMRVCITVGSRGISSVAEVAATIAAEVKRLGGEPFIVPAMGSHGGATAEGQKGALAKLGVTEEKVGCPIKATMEVVELGKLPRGMPVYMDKYAATEADGIILLNRIKPHSPWGHIGSGPIKISAIGLGKQKGCNTIHSWTIGTTTLYHTLIEVYNFIRERKNILMGFAIMDNAFARPGKFVGMRPEELPEMEPVLRREEDKVVARLPFYPLDVLVVDEMGKNRSPAGIDPLVTGRPGLDQAGNPVPGQVKIKSVVVLDITKESYGNAVGIGNVDVTTRRLASKIDFYAMYMNAVSACQTWGARLPMVLPSDKEAIQMAVLSCGMESRANLRLIRAKNTLQIGEVYVSEALAKEVPNMANLEQLSDLEPMKFDENGNLF